jgi:MFS family permease
VTQSSGTAAPVVDLRGQTKNLVIATAAFAISFWAWNMIAPLAVTYTQEMGLDGNQKALLVATPVLVGALGRILAGALTDRFGGRLMMPTLILASVPFVLLVAVAGNARSYGLMLLFGFFLGIAGTTFAVGVPFVNSWYRAERRGFATGVFGAGMGGTALSAFFTPRFVTWFGYTLTHVIIAVALVVYTLSHPYRFYNHFEWQALAFLEGHAAIRFPVPADPTSPGNAFFQDVLPVPTGSDGVQRALVPFPPLPAIVLLPFDTEAHPTVLIAGRMRDGMPLPFGAEVIDGQGCSMGFVGQGGRALVRWDESPSPITVRWSGAGAGGCVLRMKSVRQQGTLEQHEGDCQ